MNGTQVWLYKKIQQTLKNLLKKEFPKSEIKIHPCYVGTSDDNFTLAQLRKTLGEYNAAYKKRNVNPQVAPSDGSNQANDGNKNQQKQGQKETSHIIDATLVFAKALVEGKENFKTPLIPDSEVLDFSSTTTAKWLESLLPEDLELVPITRKPTYRKSRPFTASIFKQGMYAERFLSLLVLKDKVNVGFTPTLSHKLNLKDAEELFKRLKPFLKHGKNFVDKDLEYYQNLKTPMDYVLLKIDRQKAKEYLQNCKSDDLVGQTLEGLRYVTQNKKILNDKNKLAINLKEGNQIDGDDINSDNDSDDKDSKKKKSDPFIQKFNIPNIDSFSLTLPFKQEWERVNEKLNQLDLKNTQLNRETIFPKTFEYEFSHKTTARKLSLPTKGYPPSGGFRILRKTPHRESVFQVHTTEGHYIGFAKEDGKVNFNQSVLNPIFLNKSISIYELEKKQDEPIPEIAEFDEWRELPISEDWEKAGIKKLYMKLATQDRRDIQLVVDSSKFFSKTPQKSDLYDTRSMYQFEWKSTSQNPDKFIGNITEIITSLKLVSQSTSKQDTRKSKKQQDKQSQPKEKHITTNPINDKNEVRIFITGITKSEVTLAFRISQNFPKEFEDLFNQGTIVKNL